MKNKLYLILAIASALIWVAIALYFTPTEHTIKIEDITPLHTTQQVRKCYSAFDIYLTDAYELVDDNKTLITSHGRVYNTTECNLVKDK